jgi:hypothetical protein
MCSTKAILFLCTFVVSTQSIMIPAMQYAVGIQWMMVSMRSGVMEASKHFCLKTCMTYHVADGALVSVYPIGQSTVTILLVKPIMISAVKIIICYYYWCACQCLW